jgi:hypothetical protein
MPDENAELSYEEFARARKLYQRPETANGNHGAPAGASATSLVQDGSDFMLYSAGPRKIFAVFEDFSQAGWFYLYDAAQQKILKSAYIYNRANVAVEEDVIDIGWAADDSACGLALWGEFRAFLGVSSDMHIAKPVTNSEDSGIPPAKWPAGFELYLEKKIE